METAQRLDVIQSMLTAGHRSVRLDTHTLLVWGLGGGTIVAFTDYVITVERFPEIPQRAFALLLWLAFWLGGMAWFDHKLTRQHRAARDEVLPFAQAQISRAWWMLMGLGSLSSVAMFFFGGGQMIYAMWTVLLGLGMYLFGLFSKPLTEWLGLATLLLGMAGLAAGIPFSATHWLAASCFAIGLPLAGLLARYWDDHSWARRSLALGGWLAVVVLPPLGVTRLTLHHEAPAGPVVSLQTLAASGSAGVRIVDIPAGTVVPFKLVMDSPLVKIDADASLPMTLTRPLQVVFDADEPEGRYRYGDGPWHSSRDGMTVLKIPRLQPRLDHGQLVVRADAHLHYLGDQP